MGAWSPESGLKAFKLLLAQYPRMDAVFVSNDQMALAVLYAASRQGLRVPHDLGVAGFDGISESEYFNPPLTTVYPDFRGLGALALRKILLIQDPELSFPEVAADKTITAPQLIVRQSTRRI
jgi:DNA-binding LacI/PurR family transcriptional regulator